jgi:alpha-D-ribose 1-methylphosphonate 5-triphosphate synthase subunit PhnH
MINIVHDVVGSYRQLIEANSYPGKINSFSQYIKKNTIITPFYHTTLLFVYMLLDSEVSFCVVGEKSEQSSKLISKLTYAKQTSVELADFIFILSSADDEQINDTIIKAKIGDLIDPHKSATLICEVESVTKGAGYTISGPGIKNEERMNIDFCKDWAQLRQEKNKEFPLGIEMYFVDENSDILALPRTTQMKGVE